MNRADIRVELDKEIKHMPLCLTQRKDGQGECTCYQKGAVDRLWNLIIQILKGNK